MSQSKYFSKEHVRCGVPPFCKPNVSQIVSLPLYELTASLLQKLTGFCKGHSLGFECVGVLFSLVNTHSLCLLCLWTADSRQREVHGKFENVRTWLRRYS